MEKTLCRGNGAWLLLSAILIISNGCGGGSGSSSATGGNNTSTTYGGQTSQAAITQSNAKTLADAGSYSAPLSSVAGGSQQDAPSLRGRPAPAANAAVLAPQTVSGSCGGTAVSDSAYDSVTSRISGTTTYTGYCRNGITENGQTAFSGTFSQAASSLDVLFTFSDYSTKDSAGNILTNGTATLQGTLQGGGITSGSMVLNTVVKDNNTGRVLKMEDVRSSITATTTHTDVTISSGKVYHPDFGYVDLSTLAAIRTNSGERHPSSGVLVMTGANNAKARVTYVSNTQYKVEVDETGGGTYTFVGTYDWASLSASGTAPAISSISPPSGAAGATVTITGANFSTTIANNTVKFSGTSAIVTSATATQIVTTVPTGAATGPITVTTAGATASSSAVFTVTTAGNAALVGLWQLSTENGQPLPTDISAAVILNPDNTYIMALISNSTGSYCTESGTYGSDGTVMTDTITASTCNPDDVNTTSTANYQVSGNTLTTTNTDGTVLVWVKETTAQPQLVGKWGDMTVSGAQYYNSATGWSTTNGGGAQIEFKPDGTFTRATYFQSGMYTCSWTFYVWITGTFTVNGNTLTFAETEHYKKNVDTCNASTNFDGPVPLETKTSPWSIQQVADTFAGESWYTGPASHTTLFLDMGTGSLPYRRQE